MSGLLAFMAVSGVLGWLNLQKLAVSVTVPEELYAGGDTLVAVRVANTKRLLPSLLLRIDFAGCSSTLPCVAARAEEACTAVFQPLRRGEIPAGTAVFSSAFPINFFVRSRTVTLDGSVCVFPRPLRGVMPPVEGAGVPVSTGCEAVGGTDGEVDKIAEYSPADPVKAIHWRLSARHDTLKVKRFSAPAAEPVVIDLEAIAAPGVEERLSAAAFLINHLMKRNNVATGLKGAGLQIEPDLSEAHRLRLLKVLALYGTG